MSQETAAFMDALTKSPQLKVLNVLAQAPSQELTKTELAQRARIGRTTLYRVWADLEKMKAITPSRQVGAVTLYRLNPQSPVVQSLMNITRALTSVTAAVGKVDEIRDLERTAKEEFGHDLPIGPSVLVKLFEVGAVDERKAVSVEMLRATKDEREAVKGLLASDLVKTSGDRVFLTALGVVTARGARKIWAKEEQQVIDETLSSAKVALDLINQEIRKLKTRGLK